jgi:hypothetical protein
MHLPLIPAGGGPLKPKRHHLPANVIRSWSFAGVAWAHLRVIICPGGFAAWVELETGTDDDELDDSAQECLRAWIAGTLRDPQYIPTSVRRMWLIQRARQVQLNCHIAPAP